MNLYCKKVRHLILHKNQCWYEIFLKNWQRFAHIFDFITWDNFLCSPYTGGQKDQRGTYIFFCVVLILVIKKINQGHIFLCVRSLWGTFFLSRFFVKALCARSARFAGKKKQFTLLRIPLTDRPPIPSCLRSFWIAHKSVQKVYFCLRGVSRWITFLISHTF